LAAIVRLLRLIAWRRGAAAFLLTVHRPDNGPTKPSI